jgi:hypothetical protein
MVDGKLGASKNVPTRSRTYRAITRHTDGRIIRVQDFQADSDNEAVTLATARGEGISMDLWSATGLVRSFGFLKT